MTEQLSLPISEDGSNNSRTLRFTYGHQFEPNKFSLLEIIQLCSEFEPERNDLEQQIAERFFSEHSSQSSDDSSAASNISKLAMNCFLSLRAYKLLEDTDKRKYQLTDLSRQILNKQDISEINLLFARHILTNLTGMSLLKAIEAINTRGETPHLETIAYELQEMGFYISPNAIYTSTMRRWLEVAGIFEREYEINWDKVSDVLGINKDYVDELYTLTPEQKYFLLAMIHMDIRDFTPWNQITKYVISVYKVQVRFTTKSFVQQVINPLVAIGLIESGKTTTGRGAKPNSVRLTDKAYNELVASLLQTIANQSEISQTELNRSFEDVLSDLDNNDKHIKGKALELLAIWMIRLTSLRFTKWRKRDIETGDGEVDVLAGSDRFVYSRWQIQCKNTRRVDVDVLAKEIGMTFVTGADVVMVVTTGEFTRSAYQYAYRMMEVSRYYMILLEKKDIEEIKQDKTNIVKILDRRARRTFAKKELAMTDKEIDEIEIEEDSL